MGVVVFILTKKRTHCVERVLPHWLDQKNVEWVVLAVEPQDVNDYRPLAMERDNVSVFNIKKNDHGVNFARGQIVKQADHEGLKNFIMADDDVYPSHNSDVSLLCRDLKKTPTIGIGIMLSFYGLMFGNETIRELDEPLMSINSLGKRLFSLDTQRVLEAGNFDKRFNAGWGDDELVRQAMKEHGFGWWVHAGVKGASIKGRYAEGGLSSLHKNERMRKRAQEACHQIAFEKWGPKYINKPAPGKRLLCKWRRMLDDFVPNWKQLATWRNV